jgi:hypothetical protein
MPGLNIPTDFFRYLVLKGLASFDDVGVRMSLPPGVPVPVEYAPPYEGEVWLLYYMSFGDVPADAFAVRCRFTQSKYGGMMFEHECRPLGYEIIDPGCVFFCPLVKGFPFLVTVENITDTPQVFKARLWQLRIIEKDMPRVMELYDEFVQAKRLRESIQELSRAVRELAQATQAARVATARAR